MAVSCQADKNKFSNVPFLKFNWLSVYNNGTSKDSFILLNFHYQDGDGNIGLNPDDTSFPFGPGQPFFYNLHITMLEKHGILWKQVPNPFSPSDSINFNERIENITPKGKYKWIEGDMEFKIPAEPLGAKPDTIKLQIQLFDRAKNPSNRIETEEIVLKH